jgi:hypothetical protein
MKLPDFTSDKSWNDLRNTMGAELVSDLGFVSRSMTFLTEEELIKLSEGNLEVDLSKCQFNTDGTISYKGKRVSVYIRDRHMYSEEYALPKFHLTSCRTLRKKISQGEFQKYVVGTRDDGLFLINLFIGNKRQQEYKKLEICKNCLSDLNWDNYRRKDEEGKNVVYAKFRVADFYIKYPKDILEATPKYNSDNAPLNQYPSNWRDIRASLIRSRGAKCELCGLADRQGVSLDVHHKNGLRYDNDRSNLQILCRICHTKFHSHMRNTN